MQIGRCQAEEWNSKPANRPHHRAEHGVANPLTIRQVALITLLAHHGGVLFRRREARIDLVDRIFTRNRRER